MSAGIDHAEEAERALAVGADVVGKIRDAHHAGNMQAADDYGKKAMGCWAQAQAHATLALAEQQRIANLIAIGANAGQMVAAGIGSVESYLDVYKKINPQITEGLGL